MEITLDNEQTWWVDVFIRSSLVNGEYTETVDWIDTIRAMVNGGAWGFDFVGDSFDDGCVDPGYVVRLTRLS